MLYKVKCYLDDVSGSAKKQWLLAAFFTFLFSGLAAMIYPITFTNRTNDDYLIMMYLAGYRTGVPSDFAFFVNPIFSKGLCWLYELQQHINWYTYIHIIGLLLSICTIFKCFIKEAYAKAISEKRLFVILICIYIFFFMYPFVWLSFTTTPAVVATAGVLLFFSTDHKAVLELFLSAGLIFFAYIWRAESTGIVILFWILCICYKIWLNFAEERQVFQKKVKVILVYVTLVLGVFSIATGANKFYELDNADVKIYRDFTEARGSYMDFPHVTYKENPKLYEDLGLDDSLAALLQEWFFIDDRINADTFKKLTVGSRQLDVSESTYGLFNPSNSVGEAVVLVFKTIKSEPAMYIILLMDIFLFFMVNEGRRENKITNGDWLFVLLATVSVACLFLYLGLLGRFLLRVFQCIMLPYNMVLLLIIVRNLQGKIWPIMLEEVAIIVKWRGKSYACEVFLIILFLIANLYIHKEFPRNLVRDKNAQVMMNREINNMAIENPKNIYIYDYSRVEDFIDAFPNFNNGLPTNLIHWGGWVMFSPVIEQQLKINGISKFDASIFLKENVYFITFNDRSEKLLERYLQKLYGNNEITSALIKGNMSGASLKCYKFKD